jgi:hypothetical protein
MRLVSIFVLLVSTGSAMAQTNQNDPPQALEKLCGKLVHSEDVRVKNTQNTFETRTRNLPRVSVNLYRANDGQGCCDKSLLVAKATTTHWGAFHFDTKKTAGGLYWIVVKPEGRENKLLVRYSPKGSSKQLCYQTFWTVNDAGKFWISETVTLD